MHNERARRGDLGKFSVCDLLNKLTKPGDPLSPCPLGQEGFCRTSTAALPRSQPDPVPLPGLRLLPAAGGRTPTADETRVRFSSGHAARGTDTRVEDADRGTHGDLETCWRVVAASRGWTRLTPRGISAFGRHAKAAAGHPATRTEQPGSHPAPTAAAERNEDRT
ncbi:hypothetical protein Anapl_15208 [Anas platyrhynchos]|uniref:Uncharacterized protein n=1 Tax=Anas platyrhynchos TaxID=8839 RepID=R0L980_ANAPL|nr:hypothetical protein Anapl_15208 [Anas platyrhynchos]